MSLKVMICEDNERLRASLSILIDGTEGMEIVGSFGSADNILTNINTLSPSVIIMDIDMPGQNGIDGIKLVKSHFPLIQVLMFTVHDDNDKLFTCLRLGANGYLLKKTSPLQLIEAIQNVSAGGAPLTPELARRVLSSFHQERNSPEKMGLSSRESELLQLLTKGYTYKQIAAECFISMDTVRTHLKHIYAKLQVNSGNEAIAKALRMGMFE